MKQKEKMFVIDKVLWVTKNNVSVRFVFEFGLYICHCYDLYNNLPEYCFGFCTAIVYTPKGKVDAYKFGRNYIGLII